MGGPDMAPHTPQRSSRPGGAGALLDTRVDADYFPATLGARERWLTIVAVVFGVVVLSVAGIACAVKTGDPRWMFLSLPFMLMIYVMGRFAPIGYRLAPDGVRIERRARSTVIAYRRIRGLDRQPRSVAGLSMLGSQGVFGRFGTFWNMRLGFYRLYVTNRDAVVWLATDDGWVGLSPDRPDEFAEKLRARMVNP